MSESRVPEDVEGGDSVGTASRWLRRTGVDARWEVLVFAHQSLDPSRFPLVAVSGWINQQQLELIDYLREENRVLREHRAEGDEPSTMISVADWRLGAKGLGSKVLREMATIVTPETP